MIGRWHDPLRRVDVVSSADYDALRAENERLREALMRIMRGIDCSEQSYWYAEEALKEPTT